MFFEFLDALAVPRPDPVQWRLALTDVERAAQAAWREPLGSRPLAAIVPASASHKKDWLPERWARVAASLARDFGFQVVLAGGPGEREVGIARSIARESGIEPELITSGDDLASLLTVAGGAEYAVQDVLAYLTREVAAGV